MMDSTALPELVLVPGAWHSPECFNKIINLLEQSHLKCSTVTLPSTLDNPDATFKDDIDAAQQIIRSITDRGQNVTVIAHLYGGMVGNSALKGLTTSSVDGIAKSLVWS